MSITKHDDKLVDEAMLESFPASDPPAWTLGSDPAPASAEVEPAPAKKPKTARRDATGHLDPKYAADLRARSLENARRDQDDRAFVGRRRAKDDLAENLGEGFVASATSGEEMGEETLNAVVAEEAGGPFVVTTLGEEVADDVDASNPEDATREPFPRT